MKKLNYIVGVDGSDCSKRALQRAITLATSTQANVKVVYALDLLNVYPLAIEGYIPPSVSKDEQEKLAFEHVIKPLLNEFDSEACPIKHQIVFGDPIDEIQQIIKSDHANMVFVGRQGRSRIVDILLGSVANKLAHHVGIPIVLVP